MPHGHLQSRTGTAGKNLRVDNIVQSLFRMKVLKDQFTLTSTDGSHRVTAGPIEGVTMQ